MTCHIIDAGPLIAFCSEADAHHTWAIEQLKAIRPPLLSCEAVLAEVDFVARSRGCDPAVLYSWISEGVIEIPFRLREQAGDVAALLRRYRDQQIQLADACLVRMTELFQAGALVF
jgi:uncharacterized protein